MSNTSSDAQPTPSDALDDAPDDEGLFPIAPRRGYDRRRQERRFVAAPVRFMTANGEEHVGSLRDISPIGLGIASDIRPALESRIVVYIDQIGRFEGLVVREDESGFGVQMLLSDMKLERLERAVQRWFDENHPDAEPSDRRTGVKDRRAAERRAPDADQIIGVTARGDKFKCTILNISLTGIEVATSADLYLGEEIQIGAVRGVVVRATENGFAINRVEAGRPGF
ncbi:MAG: PilZ domain-containing protein [Pseudomonadota bacterium]